MEIIVETGMGILGANSYVGIDEAADYANVRGLSLPCNEEDLKVLAFRAMDYIESFSLRFVGERALATQSLSWPRVSVVLHCLEFPSDSIPSQLKSAQIYTMVALHNGFDPMLNIKTEPFVTQETIGPMTIKYAKPEDFDSPAYRPATLPMVNALLSVLMEGGGSMVRFVKV